jgi:hypothetical protein
VENPDIGLRDAMVLGSGLAWPARDHHGRRR